MSPSTIMSSTQEPVHSIQIWPMSRSTPQTNASHLLAASRCCPTRRGADDLCHRPARTRLKASPSSRFPRRVHSRNTPIMCDFIAKPHPASLLLHRRLPLPRRRRRGRLRRRPPRLIPQLLGKVPQETIGLSRILCHHHHPTISLLPFSPAHTHHSKTTYLSLRRGIAARWDSVRVGGPRRRGGCVARRGGRRGF